MILLAASIDFTQSGEDISVLERYRGQHARIVMRVYMPKADVIHVYTFDKRAGGMSEVGRITQSEPTDADRKYIDVLKFMQGLVAPVDVEGNRLPPPIVASAWREG